MPGLLGWALISKGTHSRGMVLRQAPVSRSHARKRTPISCRIPVIIKTLLFLDDPYKIKNKDKKGPGEKKTLNPYLPDIQRFSFILN
jgi:hypothetical protein